MNLLLNPDLGRQLTIEESFSGVFSRNRKRKTPVPRTPASSHVVDLTLSESGSDDEEARTPKKPKLSLRNMARKTCTICNECTTDCQW